MLSLADVILILHFIYVLGVLVPIPLIVIGRARWPFIRNSWFRTIHLAMSTFVVLETVVGIVCPLTWLEQLLRQRAGEVAYQGSFIAFWIGRLLFYDWQPWVFLLIYIAIESLVVALYFLIPPRWLLP